MSCAVKQIRIKTRRGKVVTFRGRPGGQKKNGGECSNKKRRITAHMRTVGRAGKKCAKKGRPGSKANAACLRAELR
ncbi:MAG: hypothetical protein KA310_03250 [Pseudomonadales bacterium]|nr:hypothetical protein [Pseudomonadales bacterium]